MMALRCRSVAWIFILSLIVTPFPACKRTEAAKPPIAAVTVAQPVQRTVTRYHDFTGRTEAVDAVEIRARVKGFLKSKEFEDASQVQAGDMLFIIDPSEYQAKRDKARAELDAYEADLDNSEKDLARVMKSSESGAVSQREVSLRNAERDRALASVAAAKASLVEAELNLGYTRIRTPIEGQVSRDLVSVGNLVGAGENTLLTTVIKMQPMYAYFEVPERILLQALADAPPEKRREPDRVILLGLVHEDGHPHEGTIGYIDNTVDPQTGTIQVRATFPNDDLLLYPGAFARIRLHGEAVENALLVDERALGSDLGGKYLLTVNEQNIVEQRRVQVGARYDGWRLIESGLSPDDLYIVKGLQRARPGLPVKPELEPTEEAPPVTEVEEEGGTPK